MSASQEVLSALVSSEEWERYASLTEALTAANLGVLSDARKRVNVLLNPKRVVEEYEDSRLERRHTYRREQVQSVVDELQGTLTNLANAFEAIDDLIDDALVNVHGQLVVSGPPATIDSEGLEIDGPK
jgi:malonyl CoA-acyl carrier protein transacylase